jgi:hypothetical protein
LEFVDVNFSLKLWTGKALWGENVSMKAWSWDRLPAPERNRDRRLHPEQKEAHCGQTALSTPAPMGTQTMYQHSAEGGTSGNNAFL